jgi:hypothetical protein
MIFNINIHQTNNLTYLETLFTRVQALPLPVISHTTTINQVNPICGYLHQLIMFINHIEVFENNAATTLRNAYVKVLNAYITLAKKLDKNFPQCECTTASLVELKGIIQYYTNSNSYGGDSPRFGVHCKDVVLNMKRDLLLKSLSVYYKDIYFTSSAFTKVKQIYMNNIMYKHMHQTMNTLYHTEHEYQLNYPSTIRNYSSAVYFTPKIFLKHDLRFFDNANFKITHPYCAHANLNTHNKPLLNKQLHINTKNNLLFYDYDDNSFINKYECDLIGFNVYFGVLSFSKKYVMFTSSGNVPDSMNDEKYFFTSITDEYTVTHYKQLVIPYNEIEEIIQRRFLYMNKALEVFLKNGKSYFFNFLSVEECQNTIECLNELKQHYNTLGLGLTLTNIKSKQLTFRLISNPKEYFMKSNYKLQWKESEIDTFQYLLHINKYSSRTYNDFNQYPIIPWPFLLLRKDEHKSQQHTSSTNININFNITETYPYLRKANYPISIQTKKKQIQLTTLFDDQTAQLSNFKSHFGIHYSTSAYIPLYLARLYPYPHNQIKLQTDKLETPNRQLNSLSNLFLIFLETFDNREAIPELLTSFEYFYNLNFVYFGLSKYINEINLVHNIVIPDNFKSPCEFVCACRYVLNYHLTKTIHKWINMIFGEKQYTDKLPKKEGYYVYRKSSYAQKMNLIQKLNKHKAKLSVKDLAKKMNMYKSNILCFGQSPQILFDQSHSEWKEHEKQKDKAQDEFSFVGNFTWDSMESVIHVQSHCIVLYFNLTSENNKLYIVKKVLDSKRCPVYVIEIPKDNVSIQIQKMKFFHKHKHHSTSYLMPMSPQQQQQQPLNTGIGAYMLLHPKYAMFDLCNGKYFVTGRNYSNSIIIYQSIRNRHKKTHHHVKDYIYKEIHTGSFVSVLYQVDSASFFSGHRNGRVIEWEIKVNEHKKKKSNVQLHDTYGVVVNIKRDILCHNNVMISCIHYNKKHNVMVTCAEDGNIFIRKYYDFELMVVIGNLKGNEMYNDIYISNYDLLYATYSERKGHCGSYLVCYSLNGIKAGSLMDNSSSNNNNKTLIEINNMCVTSYGKVIVCVKNENLYLVNAFNLSDRTLYKPYYTTMHNNNNNNTNERGMEGKIVHFTYCEKMNFMHCLYNTNEIVRHCDDLLLSELKSEMFKMYQCK